MECKEFCDELIEYADGELKDERRRMVENHLGGCGPCRAAVSEIRSVMGFVAADKAEPGEEYFDGLHARVMERIRMGEADPWRLRALRRLNESYRRPVWAILSAAAALALGLYIVLRAFIPGAHFTSEEVGRMAHQARMYSPMRQLQLVQVVPRSDEQGAEPVALEAGENPAASLYHRMDDDADVENVLTEERVLAGVSTSFTSTNVDLSESDVIDLKDCIEEAFDSWKI